MFRVQAPCQEAWEEMTPRQGGRRDELGRAVSDGEVRIDGPARIHTNLNARGRASVRVPAGKYQVEVESLLTQQHSSHVEVTAGSEQPMQLNLTLALVQRSVMGLMAPPPPSKPE